MNHQFTEKLGEWLRLNPDSRDYAAGAKMFLQLTGRVNMYKNLLAAPDRLLHSLSLRPSTVSY